MKVILDGCQVFAERDVLKLEIISAINEVIGLSLDPRGSCGRQINYQEDNGFGNCASGE